MVDLSFQVENAEAVPRAAAPQLVFKLRVRQTPGGAVSVHSVALRCQVRIEPARRRYQLQEQERLFDLFGARERWSQTLRPMLWTHTGVHVPPFTDSTAVDL